MQGIGKTHVGLARNNNEDSIFVSNEAVGCLPNLYIVADGMGGHKAGEVASSKSIEYFCKYAKEAESNSGELLDFIISAITYSNDSVIEIASNDPSCHGMGTTFTVAVVKDNKAYVGHIGDSRVYLIRNGKIEQKTADHSYVYELVKAGKITAEEAKYHPERNKITRVLGMTSPVLADALIFDVKPNDHILICSDGITGMMEDRDILAILTEPNDLSVKADALIDKANSLGGFDNSSVIVIN